MNDNDIINRANRIYSSQKCHQYTDEITDEALNMIFAQRGWVCPKCGRIYSPSTPECFYCNNQNARSGATTTLDIDINSK